MLLRLYTLYPWIGITSVMIKRRLSLAATVGWVSSAEVFYFVYIVFLYFFVLFFGFGSDNSRRDCSSCSNCCPTGASDLFTFVFVAASLPLPSYRQVASSSCQVSKLPQVLRLLGGELKRRRLRPINGYQICSTKENIILAYYSV